MDGKITYHQQVSYCGKPRCRRCREGIGHGPYWYAYQTVNGRTVRTYVGKNPPPETMAAIQAEANPPVASEFASTQLRLYVLGQFRLEQRGSQNGTAGHWEPINDPSLQHQRVRSLLSCLVSSPGRKLAREQAIDVLWPELDFETASHRLDRAVHSLRQVFEPGRSRPATSRLLLTEHSTLSLADQAFFWIDADAFEGLIIQARASTDPGQTEQLLEEAAQLYSGDFLPEERSIKWVRSRRDSLRRSWIGLLLELADLRINREANTGAVEILDRLLAADPTNEAGVQRLVALLAQLGRRGEAIQAYQRFALVLKQDYKITPLPETRTLYEAILRGSTNVSLPRAREMQAPPVPEQPSPISGTSGRLAALSPAHMHIGRIHQSPLVGRDEEITRLSQLLQITEQARRLRLAGQKKNSSLLAPLNMDTHRRPQCVLLMGDVGIGKTRLAEEAAREAKRRSWAVAWSRAYVQESNVPYRLWTETLRKAMTQGLWQRQEVTRRPLIYQPLRSLLPELQDLLPQSMQVTSPPPEQEQLRLWESTRALLSTICENTTLLIVLDDLQWADSSSCELLTYLVRQMRGQSVMFLCTCRDTELPQGHHLRPLLTDLQREQVVELIKVDPLSREQIRTLVSHVPPEIVESISTRASGNPFFAEELARGVVAGDLGPLDPSNPEELPGTISAVLDLRLARISQECQRLLERGAVLGDAFRFETICAMASGGVPADEDKILDLLEEAIQAGMLAEEGNGMNITYNFWHPLLLSYLYEHISAARRASFHRRAAQVLQTAYAGREAEGAADIVHHLVNGGATAQQIAHYAELAADHAYSLADYRDAEKHYRMVLQHLGPLAPHATQEECLRYAYVLERLGECMTVLGKWEEARQYYEQVLDIHRNQLFFTTEEDKKQEAQIEALIWGEIGRTWQFSGNSEQRRICSEQAENALFKANVNGGPAWARIRFQQGNLFWHEGKYEKALQYVLESLSLFEPTLQHHMRPHDSSRFTRIMHTLAGDPVDLGRVYALLGLIETAMGQSTNALDHLNAALSIYEQHNCQREIAIVCNNQGDIYLKRSEYELAKAAFERAISVAEKTGDIPNRVVCIANLGVRSMRLGDLVDAEILYKSALTLAEQVNDPFYICLFYGSLSVPFQEQSKIKEARAVLSKALKISRSMKNAACIAFSLMMLGYFYMKNYIVEETKIIQPKGEKYINLLNRARKILKRALSFKELEADTRIEGQLALAELTLLSGDLEAAYHQVSHLLLEAQECGLIWLVASAQRFIGRILALQGRVTEADEYFQLAFAAFQRTGMQLEYARTLYAYGVSLLQASSGGSQQALNYLVEAREGFQKCHALFELQSVDRLLTIQNSSHSSEGILTARKNTRKVR
jgi:DNA-binding SARP family transcriptional activator